MLEWRKWLGLCPHKWEKHTVYELRNYEGIIGYEYVLRCTVCGKLKVVRV